MQKQGQRLFLFNYVSILTVILHSLYYYEKKNTISQTYDSIFLFKCQTTFSKPVNRGLPVIL